MVAAPSHHDLPFALREPVSAHHAVSEVPADLLAAPLISFIIPTRNEASNVAELVCRLDAIGMAGQAEIIFVDDSTDETPVVIASLRSSSYAIRLLHRPVGRRTGGLGGAVLEGFRHARGTLLLVLDSDLQHPPETSALLIAHAMDRNVDLVVGSRYVSGGDAGGLNAGRELVSRGVTLTARALFPVRLRHVSDPMSGFFLVRRDAIDLDRLQPNGFKILLEIIGRSDRLRVAEVPFHFAERQAGESKASVREMVALFETLLSLRFGDTARRVARFGIVGGSGVLVNMGLLLAATGVFEIHYAIGAAIGTVVSTGWNFALTECWVFRGRSLVGGTAQRLTLFSLLGVGALTVQEPVLLALTGLFELHYLVANLVALLVVMALRFFVADRGIWREADVSVIPATGGLEPGHSAKPVKVA